MSDWQLGLSSFVWTAPFTTDDAARFPDFKGMGFDMIEICVEDVGSLDTRVIREAARRGGVALSVSAVLGDDRNLSEINSSKRATAIAYLGDCVRFAHDVGARIVSGPLYGVPGGPPSRTEAERSVRREVAAESLREAASFAADYGVSLAVEPLNRFETDLLNTVEQGVKFCQLVDSPNVGLTLDTFHMNIEEKNLGEAVRMAGADIYSVQVSENDRGTLGSGHIDWPSVLEALRDVRYVGPLIVESFRYDIPETARAVSIWRPVAASVDDLARESVAFLRSRP